MESSNKLIESSFPVIGVDFESSCSSTSAPLVLARHRGSVCWKHHSHDSSGCWIRGLFLPLFRVPISLVTPMLCISPITSTAPAVSQLMTYGNTALSNSFSKSLVQNGIYCSDWLQLEFVCTFLSKMRLEVNILTCWGSAKWRYTGYKGLSVYTTLDIQLKARQVWFETKSTLNSWN